MLSSATVWPGIGLVVHFEAVLQAERVDIHDDRSFAGLREHVRVIQNFVFLHRDEQHVHLRVHRLEQLVAEVHVGDVERNVLAGFRRDALVQLFFGHQRQRHALDDHGVAGNRGRYVFGFNFFGVENLADGVGDLRRVHDGAVYDGVLRQRFRAETDELIARFSGLQLNGFDGARADVQSDQLLVLSAK